MPVPQVRNGNNWIERISFTKAHGAAPQQCEIYTPFPAASISGSQVDVLVSSSRWTGNLVDVQAVINNGEGRGSILTAVDFRDFLFDHTVFAKFNMIDENTGEVYTEVDLDVHPDDADFNDLGKIYAYEIISWLSAIAGFTVTYSTNAQDLLRAEAQSSWENSRYNVYNIDWSAGIKVGAALDQICELLGIQMTILFDGTRHLRFTVKGIGDIEDMLVNLTTFIVSGREGLALQPDVDTGLWVVGDRNRYEYRGIFLYPAWNEAWNPYFLDPMKLETDLKNEGLNSLVDLVGDFLPDPGFLEGRFFNDMTIEEYVRSIPFHVFRMDGIENVLTADEFDGLVPVREARIATDGLVSDPTKDFRVFAHDVKLDTKRVELPMDVADGYSEMKDGYKVIPTTGHVVFTEPRIRIKQATKDAGAIYLTPNDLEPDEPYIDAVILGKNYKSFWGTDERVGSKQVSGLRKAFTINDPGPLEGSNFITADHAGANEYLLAGEKPADAIAEDVATALLNRPRFVKSGEAEIRGTAGWMPTGDVHRVTVNVSPTDGIVERISYGNDEPSPEYEPQIELRRKIAVDRESKRIDRVKSAFERSQLRSALSLLNQGKNRPRTKHETNVKAALEALNRDNFVTVENDAEESFAFGDPVIATPRADGQFSVVPEGDVEAKDKRMIGISLSDGDGKLSVVTSGIAQAWVAGPVAQGDALEFNVDDWALQKGSGPMVALKDVPEGLALIPVRIGGGGGGTSVKAYTVDSVDDDTLWCVPVDDPEAEPVEVAKPYLLRRTPFDGNTIGGLTYTYSSAIEREVFDGTNTETQHVKEAWLVGEIIYVVEITEEETGLTGITLQDINNSAHAWHSEISAAADIKIADCASTANLALSGTANVDGVAIAGKIVLAKNQTTASQNGRYSVPAGGGAWTKIDQPTICEVLNGTVNGQLGFMLTAANTYTARKAVWG